MGLAIVVLAFPGDHSKESMVVTGCLFWFSVTFRKSLEDILMEKWGMQKPFFRDPSIRDPAVRDPAVLHACAGAGTIQSGPGRAEGIASTSWG